LVSVPTGTEQLLCVIKSDFEANFKNLREALGMLWLNALIEFVSDSKRRKALAPFLCGGGLVDEEFVARLWELVQLSPGNHSADCVIEVRNNNYCIIPRGLEAVK
jgi:hypothetical protein